MKEKYGSDYELSDEGGATDSESDESEDEQGEELTPAVDAAILRTLARIKRRDPAIYDTNQGIFEGTLSLSPIFWSLLLTLHQRSRKRSSPLISKPKAGRRTRCATRNS